jgi:hypothetical protein
MSDKPAPFATGYSCDIPADFILTLEQPIRYPSIQSSYLPSFLGDAGRSVDRLFSIAQRQHFVVSRG